MAPQYMVESDIILRAVDKPFTERQPLGLFDTKEDAYHFIVKYVEDTKNLHTYFSRTFICPKTDIETYIAEGKMIAMNVVLGQFEDSLYITKLS